MVTLGVYLVGSGLTALTPAGGHWFIFLYATRVIAGMGIGGEYAAINSAIDEMIPAKYRGRVDLAVNGTYWAGAFLGTIVTIWALNHITPVWGWRVAFLVGPVLALVIIFVRRHLPESPRWQIMHGRQQEAEGSIREIEDDVAATTGNLIGNGTDRNSLFAGYIVGAAAMILGGVIAIFCAVDAEGKALEDVATPLSVIAKPAQTIFRAGGPEG
jgi:MFS family permease